MKQLIAMCVAGFVTFLITATLSFAVYWNAPIVPCEVSTRVPASWGGYKMQRHDDWCTGSQVTAYEYPRVHHRKTKADKGVVMVLALFTFMASLGAGVAGLMLSGRRRSRSAPAPHEPAISAG
ncbi:MAG: hypothetical protein H6716_16945 [Polyangiaceae bacterium]|nr:hypothetical protein [Polyangiaceae bacterium]